ELRGSETVEVPVTHSPLPEMMVVNWFPMVLITHVLAFGTPAFGIGSGGPNRHEHWWSPPFSVLQWAPTFPAVHMSQSWSFPQSKSQSALTVQLRPILPTVQRLPVHVPVPVQVNDVPLQVPALAAVQVPTGLVQVRIPPL